MRSAVVVFALAAIACLVAHAAILHAIVTRRAAPSDPAIPRPRLFVEVIWALVPIIALAFVLTATWDRVREPKAPLPPELMKVAK